MYDICLYACSICQAAADDDVLLLFFCVCMDILCGWNRFSVVLILYVRCLVGATIECLDFIVYVPCFVGDMHSVQGCGF